MQILVGGFFFAVLIGSPLCLGGCVLRRCADRRIHFMTKKLGSEWQPARCSCTPLIARGLFFRRTRYQRILKILISLPCFRSIPPIPPRTPPSICFIVPRKPLYIRTAHRNASEPLKMRRHLPDQKRRPAGAAPPAPSGRPGLGLPCACCRSARLQSLHLQLVQPKSASAGGGPPSN